jgi:hypothetical protein
MQLAAHWNLTAPALSQIWLYPCPSITCQNLTKGDLWKVHKKCVEKVVIFVRDIKKKKSQDLTLDVKRLNRLDKKRSDYSLLFCFDSTIRILCHLVCGFHRSPDDTPTPTPPHFYAVRVSGVVSTDEFDLCGGTAIRTLYHFSLSPLPFA